MKLVSAAILVMFLAGCLTQGRPLVKSYRDRESETAELRSDIAFITSELEVGCCPVCGRVCEPCLRRLESYIGGGR